ncbi:MAG: SUMF1/EgtB/PvdO family nonheme iron enzyme [Pyrinomonadaceae bacterium]
MQNLTENPIKQTTENELRLLPLGLAAMVCFVIAVSSGSIFWYFFGSKSPFRQPPIAVALPKQSPAPETNINYETNIPLPSSQTDGNQSTVAITATPEAIPPKEPESPVLPAPAGELPVESGVIVLGGGETKLPWQRKFVDSFAIAETEVTNAQYREFIDSTNAKFKLPVGKDDEPVTGVSWSEAKAYCDWLSKKLEVEVRLPTEAEWELAARGKEGFKYPWGNEWQDDAAACKENKGKVQAVKTYPKGKSPFGAYDMVGNVWEWTADPGRDAAGKIAKYMGDDPAYKNETVYVIKGGAAIEGKANNFAQARISMPLSFSSPDVGFRYVVLREKPVQNNDNQ